MPPLVSIIIPTYNYAHYLTQAIESALAQTHRHIEVIVIDDGSTDHTAEAIKPYLNYIHYHHKTNAGLSAARNTGLSLAKGEYIQFLDADDLLASNAIESGLVALTRMPSASGAIYSNELFLEAPGDHPKAFHWQLPKESRLDCMLFFRNLAPPHCFLVKKEHCDQIEPFDTTLKACEDYDYWFRYFSKFGLPAISSGLAYYRRHTNSMSANLKQQYLYDHIVTTRIFNTLKDAIITKQTLFGGQCSHETLYIYHVALIAASLINLRNNARVNHSNQSGIEFFCHELLQSTLHQKQLIDSRAQPIPAHLWYPIKRYTKKYFPAFKNAVNLPSLTKMKISNHPELLSINFTKLLTADLRWGLNTK